VVGGFGFLLSVRFGFQTSRLFHYGMLALSLFALGLQLPSRTSLPWMAGFVLLGDASYALYLSHPFTFDAIELVMGHLVPRAIVKQGWFAPSYLVLIFVGANIAAIVFYRLLERPVTEWLSNKVRKSEGRGAVAPAPASGTAPNGQA
jgi:exopolysaccharide production protein ExoZ